MEARGRARTLERLRFPYSLAILSAFVLVLAAWLSRDLHRPVGPGVPAPEFELTNLAGETVALSDFRGSVVLINVWATWCKPCRDEMPSMERLYVGMAGEDFVILAVSIDREPGEVDAAGNRGGDVAAFRDELGLSFPILLNPSGDIQALYQTTGVPESFVVDRRGVINRRVAGPTEWDADGNVTLIRRLIEEPRG